MAVSKNVSRGTWQFDVKDNQGKRVRRTTFKTKNQAIAAEREFLAEQEKNKFGVNKDITFKEYYERWRTTHLNKNMTQGSKNLYMNSLNKFVDYFGENMKIKDITRSDFQLFINDYASTRTRASVLKVLNNLSRALADATYDGYIERTPAYKIEINQGKETQSAEDKFLSHSVFNQVRDYALQREEISYFVIYLLCITGARFGEVIKLRSDDINVNTNTLHIRGTKSKAADRYIVISKNDIDYIMRKLDRLPGENPLHISNQAVSKALRRILDKVGEERHITLHALRHTHCSVLLNNGIDIHYISKRLGHTNLAVTLDTYSHLLEERRKEEDNKIEEYLAQKWHE